MTLTQTEENYLKAIFKYQQHDVPVSTNAIAAEIKISAASVTDMLKKLKSKKLINYKSYEGCKLTALGFAKAVDLTRRHRLWETFLCTKLGYSWNQVHELAEELEHIGDAQFINKLDAFLEYPKSDPHGDAIPDVNGMFPAFEAVSLSQLQAKDTAVVHAVNSHEQGILELLNHYKISLGTVLEVLGLFQYDNSMECKVNGKQICMLPFAICNNIKVIKN